MVTPPADLPFYAITNFMLCLNSVMFATRLPAEGMATSDKTQSPVEQMSYRHRGPIIIKS